MAYNFKSIADVEVIAEPTESANVLIEENGVIKKAPKTAVGGSGNAHWVWVMLTDNRVVASEGIYKALENFYANCDTPLIIFTCRAYNKTENGYITEFASSIATHTWWYPEDEYFAVSGFEGIQFYIRKNGNHGYYWD